MDINYLTLLSESILSVKPEGISKVRFAKILYFVNKEVVRLKQGGINQLAFIRMPLGPVPLGLDKLSRSSNIFTRNVNSGLYYNKINYFLRQPWHKKNSRIYDVAVNFFERIDKYPTSELVEISHQEPSWIGHFNGQEYYISQLDLNIDFPFSSARQLTADEDNQLLQAKLVNGMIDDIVSESTTLEYPDE